MHRIPALLLFLFLGIAASPLRAASLTLPFGLQDRGALVREGGARLGLALAQRFTHVDDVPRVSLWMPRSNYPGAMGLRATWRLR